MASAFKCNMCEYLKEGNGFQVIIPTATNVEVCATCYSLLEEILHAKQD